jgi:hypothetical protein
MSAAVHRVNSMMMMVTELRESAKIHIPIDCARDYAG